ncbi:MAG: LytTR family transcriptional regulator DNA-binding domain-containing protein [Pseudomonadota bacterium]
MNGQPAAGVDNHERYLLAAAAMLGALFAAVQPDDNVTPWLALAVQWQLQCLLPMALFIGARRAIAIVLPQHPANGWWVLILSGSIVVVAFTPIALWLDITMGGETPPVHWVGALLDEFGGFAPPAFASWLALNYVVKRQDSVEEAAHEPLIEQSSAANGLQALLPASARGVPVQMKAELQYLAVTTDRGSALVLYSLRDAVAELAGVQGIQPHRSHWVRLDAVAAFERRGRQGRLRLLDGTEVPVSRSRLANVKIALEQQNR